MEITLKGAVRILTKNLLVILICSALGFAAAFLISKFLVQPTYQSTAKLYVYTKSDHTQTTNYDYLNDLNYAQKVVNTYIEMLRTDSFYQAVKEKSGLNYSVEEMKTMISFTVLNETEVFQVSASSGKPEDAKKLADAITALAPQTISSIQESALLKVVDPPGFPASPSSPNITLNSIIGFLLGVITAVLFVLLKEMLDIRIKQEEDLLSHYNLPVLGSIPAFEGKNIDNIIF